jgi:hypothetical protein
MVAFAASRKGRVRGTLVYNFVYPEGDVAEDFTRADLVFTGIDHSASSYEVRIFLNNLRAGADTPRVPDERYAGRFHVLGHGGCFGDDGHCDIHAARTDPTDLRAPHQLTPYDTYVTITAALERLLAQGGHLETVTLVPISVTPRRRDRRVAPELFQFTGIELRTYLSAADNSPE